MDDPDPNNTPWVPGRGHEEGEDRVSASLINSAMHPDPRGNLPTYSFDLGGILLSPYFNKLLCSYPYDVGTVWRQECHPPGVSDDCIPGCTPVGFKASEHDSNLFWCHLPDMSETWEQKTQRLYEQRFGQEQPCAWRPDRLATMMQLRDGYSERDESPPDKIWDDKKYYAELVFEAAVFNDNLPHSIEAFFYTDNGCKDAHDGPRCKDYAFAAHARFLEHFHLTEEDVPLLKLNNWVTRERFAFDAHAAHTTRPRYTRTFSSFR